MRKVMQDMHMGSNKLTRKDDIVEALLLLIIPIA